MKKINLLLIPLFFVIQIFSGCTNPVDSALEFSDSVSGGEIDKIDTAILEFYVWRQVPVGTNPSVQKAFVEIYQNETTFHLTGVTNIDGKFYIPSASLPQGSFKVYAYTKIGNYPDLYGVRSFLNSGNGNVISILVEHI